MTTNNFGQYVATSHIINHDMPKTLPSKTLLIRGHLIRIKFILSSFYQSLFVANLRKYSKTSL